MCSYYDGYVFSLRRSRSYQCRFFISSSSEEVARGLFRGWISRHGCPETILSDQGSNFTSKVMNRLLGILGIDKLTTSAYHPQTNGRLKRFHRSFSPMLMNLLKDEKRRNDWDEYIQHCDVIFVLYTTPADSHE
jgi:transposase InsO family protein